VRALGSAFASRIATAIAAGAITALMIAGCAGSEKSGEAQAADQLCSNVAGCAELDTFVSKAECEKQTEKQFGQLEPECYECLAEVTCKGWAAISNGDKTQCDSCPECCPKK
jgi:hypothetical protein